MDINSHVYFPFIRCQGYNLDHRLSELLEKSDFLAYILKKFLCVFLDKNFNLKKDLKGKKNEFLYKQKLMKFIYKTMNQNPILDTALVVYMRSYLATNLQEEEKRILRPNIFGKEPNIDFLENFSKKMQLMMILFNLDSNEEYYKVFNKKEERDEEYIEMVFCYNNGSFNLVYGLDKSKDIYAYEEGSD